MQSDIVVLRNKLLAFMACALFLVLMTGLLFIDVNWMNDALHEASLTEMAQEITLAAISSSFFIAAAHHAALRRSLLLAGGFFACMLIREMDFLFDDLHHGAWVWFALALAAACLIYAASDMTATLSGLVKLVQHPAWNMMAAGLLTVLIFSRLFGTHLLWQHLLADGYQRVVKNMAEEGSEMLGYSLCLFASVRYLWALRSLNEEQPQWVMQQQH